MKLSQEAQERFRGQDYEGTKSTEDEAEEAEGAHSTRGRRNGSDAKSSNAKKLCKKDPSSLVLSPVEIFLQVWHRNRPYHEWRKPGALRRFSPEAMRSLMRSA